MVFILKRLHLQNSSFHFYITLIAARCYVHIFPPGTLSNCRYHTKTDINSFASYIQQLSKSSSFHNRLLKRKKLRKHFRWNVFSFLRKASASVAIVTHNKSLKVVTIKKLRKFCVRNFQRMFLR